MNSLIKSKSILFLLCLTITACSSVKNLNKSDAQNDSEISSNEITEEKKSPIVLPDDNGKLATVDANQNWFREAQDVMIDAGVSNEVDRLTGILYKMAEKIADNSELILKHPNANAHCEACNQALEFKKHGRPIKLPKR